MPIPEPQPVTRRTCKKRKKQGKLGLQLYPACINGIVENATFPSLIAEEKLQDATYMST